MGTPAGGLDFAATFLVADCIGSILVSAEADPAEMIVSPSPRYSITLAATFSPPMGPEASRAIRWGWTAGVWLCVF